MSRYKIPDVVEGRVLALLRQRYSQTRIVNILKLDGISVAQSTVSNVKRKIGRQRNSKSKIKIFRPTSQLATSIVEKVIKKIDVENSPTQRAIAKSLSVSQSRVSKTIKRTVFVLREKRKVQQLSSSNLIKRRQRSMALYLQLANQRYKNFITTDKSWFYLDGTHGKGKVCYIKKSDPDYDRMIIQQSTSRPKGFMVWGGVSSKGKTAIRFVDPSAKVNSNYHVNRILKPFLTRDVPRLFPKNQRKKWFFHQDSAPSHTSKETIGYLNECKTSFVKPDQ